MRGGYTTIRFEFMINAFHYYSQPVLHIAMGLKLNENSFLESATLKTCLTFPKSKAIDCRAIVSLLKPFLFLNHL